MGLYGLAEDAYWQGDRGRQQVQQRHGGKADSKDGHNFKEPWRIPEQLTSASEGPCKSKSINVYSSLVK